MGHESSLRNRLSQILFHDFYIKIAFFVTTIIYCIPPFMPFVDTFFNVVLIWCMIYVIHEFVCYDTYFNNPLYYAAYIAVALFVVSYFVNGRHIVDLKVLFYTGLQLFLFTGCRSNKTQEQVISEIKMLAKITVALTFVLSLISLFMYLASFSVIYTNDVTSSLLVLGVHPNSALYGVVGNSNRSSWLCLMSIAFSVWLYYHNQKKGYFGNILLQIIIIWLSQSRGGLLGLFFLCALLCVLALVSLLKKQLLAKQFVCVLVSVAVLLSGSFVLVQGIKNVKTYIQQSQQSQIQVEQQVENAPVENTESVETTLVQPQQQSAPENEPLEARTDEEKASNVQGRLDMYLAGFRLIQQYPVFGTGHYELDQKSKSVLPPDSVMDEDGVGINFHNIFIQTAVVGGIPQLILFVVMIAWGLWRIAKGSFLGKIDGSFSVILILLLTLLLINLVEAEIYMSRNTSSTVFWILLGYGTYCCRIGKTTRLQRIFQPCIAGKMLAFRNNKRKT